MSKCMWQAAPDDASRWLTQPDLRCRLVSVAPMRRTGGRPSSESFAHVDRRSESSGPPPVRLRDSVESSSGSQVQRPSIDPPKVEYVMRAKGMTTSN